MNSTTATLISVFALLLAGFTFDVYCLRDLARAEITFVFPPQIWFVVIVFFTPFGGIAYLKLGRQR
jgi:hypothetical protein